MKVDRSQMERALRAPDPATRLLLLHGPDEAGSRMLARLLAASLGDAAERVDLSGADLKADPARLADEAASLSLFGGRRFIIVEPAGEEALPAVEALIGAGEAGNPVAMVAGALRKESKLLKFALASPGIMAFASYVPDARAAARIVGDLAREAGLETSPAVARIIAEASANDAAVMRQEIDKYALFLDASRDRPKSLDLDAIDAVGAAREEGDLSRLVDAVVGGDPLALRGELVSLSGHGVEGIPLIRTLLRRLTILARLRAEVDAGKAVAAVMAAQGKALFWKEKDAVTAQLARWPADLVAKAVSRLLEAEIQLRQRGSAGAVLVEEELFAICRQAARLKGR